MLIQLFSKIKNRFAPPKYVLGRWGNDEAFNKKKLKVDYANEDHCFCDEYLQKKIKEQNNKPNNKTPIQPRYFTGKKDFVMWEMNDKKFKH